LCFMGDKKAVGAHFYIEDAPSNIAQLRADGNQVLVYSNSTNRQVEGARAENWKEVKEAVLLAQKAWLAS